MREERRSRRAAGTLAVIAGLAAGTIASSLGALTGGEGAEPAGMRRAAGSPTTPGMSQPKLALLHTPPLLVLRTEAVELRYELVCPAVEARCAPEGTAYLRAERDASFTALPLRPGGAARQDRWYVRVPRRFLAGSSFFYYAVMGDRESGLRMTVPAGGAAGPQQAWVLDRPHVAELGAHRFGRTRPPEAVVARAAWGRGAGALGLRAGREQATVGPSAFDVGSEGSVRILDQVNHRLAIYRPGTATRPARVVPLAISGAMADLVTGAGGTVYVLDQGRHGQMAVRAFGRSGRQLGSSSLPGAVVADQYPDETWLPATPPGGRSPRAAQPAASARAGRPVTIPPGADPSARPTAEAGAVVIRALPHEARVALVGGTRVLAAWRLRSSTTLGELGLAEPLGAGLVVVVYAWTETQAEQQVLRPSPSGVEVARWGIGPPR